MTRTALALALSVLFLVAGCSDDAEGPAGPGGGGSTTELGRVLDEAGEFDEFQETYEETEAVEFEETSGNDQYYCTRKTVSLTEGYSDFPQFDPNARIVFPGNLLQGNTLDDATPSEIPVDRGPGTYVITLINGTNTSTVDVDEVSLGSAVDAMNEIIAGTPDDLPARTTVQIERITSREQLGVSLRAEYETLTTEIQGSFEYQSDVSYNRYLVRLTQSYYTIAFQTPTDAGDFFGPDVTSEQLSRYVQPGNPAAYISSVTYGRVFYLLIQSTDSLQEVDASVRGSFDKAVAGGELEADVTYVSELSEVQIGGYALGGVASQAAAALTGDFEALKTFIAEGGTITTGVPLSYTVNAANDPARELKVKVATEYDVVDCAPLSDALPDGIAWYRGSLGVSWYRQDGIYKITRWEDQFGAQRGDDSRDATVPFGGSNFAGYWVPGNPDGGRIPSFEKGSSTIEPTGRMRLPGTALRDTDYTVVAVLNRIGVPPSDDTPAYWLWGDGNVEGQVIRMGFDDSETFGVSHGGSQKLTTTLDRSIAQLQLYVVTFSQEEGTKIFINGLEKAHDPNLTLPISLFTGASLGVNGATFSSPVGFTTFRMAEMQIYDFVPSDAQRRALEEGLMERYRF